MRHAQSRAPPGGSGVGGHLDERLRRPRRKHRKRSPKGSYAFPGFPWTSPEAGRAVNASEEPRRGEAGSGEGLPYSGLRARGIAAYTHSGGGEYRQRAARLATTIEAAAAAAAAAAPGKKNAAK